MRKGSAMLVAGGMLLAACGGDGEPTNAERPDEVVEDTSEVLDEVEVPTPTAVPAVVEPEQLTYTVQAGDLLSTIAQNFGVTVDAILAANPDVEDANVIQVGDELVIPAAPPAEGETATATDGTGGTATDGGNTADDTGTSTETDTDTSTDTGAGLED